jgi:hypothetical protein
MSQKQVQRVKAIENAAGGKVSVREASRRLQLSERQVQRRPLSVRLPGLDTAWQPRTFHVASQRRARSAQITTSASLVLPPKPLASFVSCPAASISPVASACTTSAWFHRSHRHPKRPYRLPAALAGPAWLSRRNRRTVASAGPHLALVSRRSPSPRAAPAA